MRHGPDPVTRAGHPGTKDLDLGMQVALLDSGGYGEIPTRLRQEGFSPDTNAKGNPTPQRWKRVQQSVTIDFLLPPLPGRRGPAQVQPLEPDFGALIIPGVELTADEREWVEIDGHTLDGEHLTRAIPVCGPAAFVVLKALAFADRVEPKDAYDLVYVIRRWPTGVTDIADRLLAHSHRHGEIVEQALKHLDNDFRDVDRIGPLRAAEFDTLRADDFDAAIADAQGYVDNLLRRCRSLGL
jgi:Nucleotidyl transferase AbiEii toxin, Type IV TA system